MGFKQRIITPQDFVELILVLMNDDSITDMADIEAALTHVMENNGLEYKCREEVENTLDLLGLAILTSFDNVEGYFLDQLNSEAITKDGVALNLVKSCIQF